jgi:hypothetical protein
MIHARYEELRGDREHELAKSGGKRELIHALMLDGREHA